MDSAEFGFFYRDRVFKRESKEAGSCCRSRWRCPALSPVLVHTELDRELKALSNQTRRPVKNLSTRCAHPPRKCPGSGAAATAASSSRTRSSPGEAHRADQHAIFRAVTTSLPSGASSWPPGG